MSRLQPWIGAVCAATMLTAGAAAQGIVPDRTTFVTIDAPVSLPGTVLPAGTYMFRLADTQATRNVIQIFDKDRSRIFATLITVNVERNEVSDDAVITFRETEATAPPALRFWYYAGERTGHEFVYPKDQAVQIARSSGESVLAIDTTTADMEAMAKGEISRVDGAEANAEARPAAGEQPAATRSSVESAQSEAASVTGRAGAVEQPEPLVESNAAETRGPADPVEQAPATQSSSPASEQARSEQAGGPSAGMAGAASAAPRPTGTSGRTMADARADSRSDSSRELPRTASELPVVTLIGFLALGGYFGVRAFRRGSIV